MDGPGDEPVHLAGQAEWSYGVEQSQVREFFQTTHVDIEANTRLRIPQRDGYTAIKNYFDDGGRRALGQIPVGCGKSGLITLLPFGVAEARVLVIAPNLQIRDQLAEAFDVTQQQCFYRTTGVLADLSSGPWVAKLDAEANLSDIEAAHVVVTNIQQMSANVDRWLPNLPSDLFDLIIVDEGHHNAALSWQSVFDQFPDAKIISLTATPFRGDDEPVDGEIVYRYPFREAMTRGYIKEVTALNVAPTEIAFTYRGDSHLHTLDEVLELRDEDWFSKGVALAQECNISIVDASIQALENLREEEPRAQMIAVACSLEHARQVRSLYQERGLEASEVHSGLPPDARRAVLQRLSTGELDVIVQVQMLGEGFDHQPLAVAAVFRPFRSLSPYIQFVGRVMRVMEQEKPGHPSNRAFVVSHVGLNIDRHWDDFKQIDEADQELIRDWLEAENAVAPPGRDGSYDGTGRRRRLTPQMQVASEVLLERFLSDPYLDPADDAVLDNFVAMAAEQGLDLEALGLDRDELRRRMSDRRADVPEGPHRLPVQPQAHRRELRRRLNEQTKSASSRICEALGEPITGVRIAMLGGTGASNNLGAVIADMNRAVNRFLGHGEGERRELSLDELERAITSLDDIADGVQDALAGRLR